MCTKPFREKLPLKNESMTVRNPPEFAIAPPLKVASLSVNRQPMMVNVAPEPVL